MITLNIRSGDARAGEVVDLIERLTDQLKSGTPVDVKELIAEHPEHADEIERLMPALALLVDLSRNGEPPAVGEPPALGEPPASAGGALGDFRILREVGRGGMGVVYEAHQISLNRRVALKVLPFAATMDSRHLQRFKNEAQAAASLEHANIVPVYGVGCERGVHYYAMKFIEGQTLAEVIRDRHPVEANDQCPMTNDQGVPKAETQIQKKTSPDLRHWSLNIGHSSFFRRIAELIAQAADALEYSHSMGVVHRDIKPGNLMLDAAGRIWITDFGLAKMGADAGVTMSGDLLGTLRYMSPEQALAKHGLVDHRTDVYSLGATLYELLTNQPAVPGDDKQEVLGRIAFIDPVNPRTIDVTIPRDLETIVLKTLEKEVNSRYSSAKELADDLRRWMEEKPICARPPTRFDRLTKWAGRHRALVVISLTFLVVATVGLATGMFLLNRANREEASQRALAKDNLRMSLRALEDTAWLAYESLVYRPTPPTPDEIVQVEKLLEFYSELALKNPDDAQLRLETAKSHQRAGLIFAALGKNDRAEDHIRKGVAMAAKLVVDRPDNTPVRGYHARSLYELGLYLQRREQFVEAQQSYLDAIRIAEPVWDEVHHANDGITLAESYAELAEISLKHRRNDEAVDRFRQSVRFQERLTSLDADNPRHVGYLGLRLSNLAKVLAFTKRIDEAELVTRQATIHTHEAITRQPADTNWQISQAQIYEVLGVIAAARMRTDEQLDAMRSRSATLEWLVTNHLNHPSLATFQFQLDVVNYDIGVQQKSLGRHADALASFSKVPETSTVYSKAAYGRLWLRLTAADLSLRDPVEAMKLAQWGAGQKGDTNAWRSLLALAQHKSGDSKSALSTLDELAESTGKQMIDMYFIRAMALHRLGERDPARQTCKAAFDAMNEDQSRHNFMLRTLCNEALYELGLTEADLNTPKPDKDMGDNSY